jgi:hypothetical protein
MKCGDCGGRMSLPLANIGQPVIVGEQVYSADKYVCVGCGAIRFGTPGQEPVCLLADYPEAARLRPIRLEVRPV